MITAGCMLYIGGQRERVSGVIRIFFRGKDGQQQSDRIEKKSRIFTDLYYFYRKLWQIGNNNFWPNLIVFNLQTDSEIYRWVCLSISAITWKYVVWYLQNILPIRNTLASEMPCVFRWTWLVSVRIQVFSYCCAVDYGDRRGRDRETTMCLNSHLFRCARANQLLTLSAATHSIGPLTSRRHHMEVHHGQYIWQPFNATKVNLRIATQQVDHLT